jgi:hypothetical protein
MINVSKADTGILLKTLKKYNIQKTLIPNEAKNKIKTGNIKNLIL